MLFAESCPIGFSVERVKPINYLSVDQDWVGLCQTAIIQIQQHKMAIGMRESHGLLFLIVQRHTLVILGFVHLKIVFGYPRPKDNRKQFSNEQSR